MSVTGDKFSLKYIKFMVIPLKLVLLYMDNTFINQCRKQKLALLVRCRELPEVEIVANKDVDIHTDRRNDTFSKSLGLFSFLYKILSCAIKLSSKNIFLIGTFILLNTTGKLDAGNITFIFLKSTRRFNFSCWV